MWEKLILKNFRCVSQSVLSPRRRLKTLAFVFWVKGSLCSLSLELWVKTSSFCELNLPQNLMWVHSVREEQEKQVGWWCLWQEGHGVPIMAWYPLLWRNHRLPGGVGRFCAFLGRNGSRFGWKCRTGRVGWQEDRLSLQCREDEAAQTSSGQSSAASRALGLWAEESPLLPVLEQSWKNKAEMAL